MGLSPTDEIKILDHGYLKVIEWWGSDERIVEAARMSTGKGFLGWGDESTPGDEKLLRFLWEHKHATPFEMAGLTIEVQAPIFVFREWHRHRTQCLAGSTELHFDLPGGIERRGSQLYKRTIAQIVESFEHSDFARNRIRGMMLRCVDEDTYEVSHTKIVNAWRSGEKDVYDVTLVGGITVRMSMDHRVLTDHGWLRLCDFEKTHERDGVFVSTIVAKHSRVAREMPVFTHDDIASEEWRPVPFGDSHKYEVSSLGRVRSLYNTRGKLRAVPLIKEPTPTASGYLAVSLSVNGTSTAHMVHNLVLVAFSERAEFIDYECRHLDGNGWNNRVSNLKWGTMQENASDRVEHDAVPRLRHTYAAIESIKHVGVEQTYDIEVAGPFYNFSANGMIVHNSYNEMSARYIPLPDVNYIPTIERLMINSKTNKQAGTIKGAAELDHSGAEMFQEKLREIYERAEALYQEALHDGVPKELARVHLPVGRYSRMRASANLRNWLAFLTLRMDPAAQYEIRRYANQVGAVIDLLFPRTFQLFMKGFGHER